MALLAVGPVDPKALAKDIERMFSGLKAQARERPATLPHVPYHKEMLAKVVVDSELTATTMTFLSRFENELSGKPAVRQALVQGLVATMMDARLCYARSLVPED